MPGCGEILAIYISPNHWRHGAGTILLSAADEVLRDAGMGGCRIWVLEENHRARTFYERQSYVANGERKNEEIGGKALPTVQYCKRFAVLTPPRPLAAALHKSL